VEVRPYQSEGTSVDLLEVVEGLEARGISPPVLIRFPDLLGHRLKEIHSAFRTAISDHDYQGNHLGVYPIKVNQQRQVVEAIYEAGAALGFGLEVGSKPELVAVLGITRSDDDRLIICNGFKDDEYIESAILARKLGRNVVPVVEDIVELRLILKHAERYDIEPRFGVRVKLAATGSGRWSQSAGSRSKFGLTVAEILQALEELAAKDMGHCLELLHCHMGSQIHDIKRIKEGINELAQVYVGLHKLGAGLRYLDIGGGLGVDYDGSRSNVGSSINYTLEEYAADVIYRVMNVCDNGEVPHPSVVTECGRAMVAHHSVLIFNVLGSTSREDKSTFPDDLETTLDDEVPQPIFDLVTAYRSADADNLVSVYHDAVQARDEAMHLFNLGYLDLTLRGLAERLFWATCTEIRDLSRTLEVVPEELVDIEEELRDIYFCNFSLFQSLPDSWALRQVFPVMPIHRLNEVPTRLGILADITCDSDGKIDLFPQHQEMKNTLELHELQEGQPYYLGVFLVGAYQETLGDLHNLFGDTHVVHVQAEKDTERGWKIQDVIDGDTVREVLGYFQYSPDSLLERVRSDCEEAVSSGRMKVSESRALLKFYRESLDGYTYLEPEED
jgi:arginine decarboxylase